MDALDEHFARRGALTQAQSTLNDSAQQVIVLYTCVYIYGSVCI
jgi:hypothetical protein